MAELTEMVKDFFTDSRIEMETMHNLLSEFLAVEKGGQKLYEKALQLISNAEVRTKFRDFLDQTVEHQRILTAVIEQLGGNPRMVSPTAKIAAKKAQGLLATMSTTGASRQEAELNAMENIVLAETKDHADWELIGKISRQTTSSRLREILGPAVRAVEEQEDEHLNWTRKKLGELQMELLNQDRQTKGSGSAKMKIKRSGNHTQPRLRKKAGSKMTNSGNRKATH